MNAMILLALAIAPATASVRPARPDYGVVQAPKACSLLTAEQVKTLVYRGQKADGPTDEIPLAAGAGSACSYSSAHQVMVYTGPNSERFIETELKNQKRDKETRHPVSGVGDKAYILYLAPLNNYQRPAAFLVAKVGSHTLGVVMQAPNKTTKAETLEPAAIEVAKAVAAKLK